MLRLLPTLPEDLRDALAAEHQGPSEQRYGDGIPGEQYTPRLDHTRGGDDGGSE